MKTLTPIPHELSGLLDKVVGPIVTVSQFEEKHPGLRKRLRSFIFRADIGLPSYVGLREAIIRIGRSVLLDEDATLKWLASRTFQSRSRGRNPHGRAGKREG